MEGRFWHFVISSLYNFAKQSLEGIVFLKWRAASDQLSDGCQQYKPLCLGAKYGARSTRNSKRGVRQGARCGPKDARHDPRDANCGSRATRGERHSARGIQSAMGTQHYARGAKHHQRCARKFPMGCEV